MEIFQPFLTFTKTSSNVPEYLSETESTEALNVIDNTQETNIKQETETNDFFENLENTDMNTTPPRTTKKQKNTISSTPKATSSAKEKIRYFKKKKPTETKNDLDLLFLSYARTIKKFSGKRQAETKLQIAQIIAQEEIMHYEEQSSSSHSHKY